MVDFLMYIETISPNHSNFAAMNPNLFFLDLTKFQESMKGTVLFIYLASENQTFSKKIGDVT